MKIQILTTAISTQIAKSGKPYQQLEVNYKNLTFNKVESKKIMPFGVHEKTFKVLSNAQQGDNFEVTIVKNAAGYNDWPTVVAIAPGTPIHDIQGAASQGSINNMAGNNIAGKSIQVKSTYETPEERAIKQRYIIKQSSLSGAINLLTVGAKSPPATEAVLALADTLVAYVMQNPEDVVKQDVFSMDNDIEVL